MTYERTNERPWKYVSTGVDCRRIHPRKGDPYAIELWSNGYLAGVYNDGLLCVNEGYKWDGFTSSPDITKALDSSKYHDILCQFQCVPEFDRLVSTRAHADKIFFDMLKADNVALPIALIYFLGVKIGGMTAPKKHQGLSIKIIDTKSP